MKCPKYFSSNNHETCQSYRELGVDQITSRFGRTNWLEGPRFLCNMSNKLISLEAGLVGLVTGPIQGVQVTTHTQYRPTIYQNDEQTLNNQNNA